MLNFTLRSRYTFTTKYSHNISWGENKKKPSLFMVA